MKSITRFSTWPIMAALGVVLCTLAGIAATPTRATLELDEEDVVLSDAVLATIRGTDHCKCTEVPQTDCSQGGCAACHENFNAAPANCVSPKKEAVGMMRNVCDHAGQDGFECVNLGDIDCYDWHHCTSMLNLNTRCAGPNCGAPGGMIGWQCRECIKGAATGESGDANNFKCSFCS